MTARPVDTASRDSSDFLNPILVKELRQGIRGTVFTGSFLLLHVLMLCASVLSLSVHSQGGDRSFADACFWFLIAIPVLLILPLAAGSSLSAEQTANTLEPLLLTRLGAREIVFGKWASAAVQTALFISAVLPYVVLRYFLGGVNLLSEVLGLLDLWFSSIILTSIAVGLALLRASALFRWLLWVAVSGFVAIQLQMLLGLSAPIGRSGRFDAWFLALTLCAACLIVWIFLEVGGLQIAPPAEARSSRLRLLAIAALLLGLSVDRLAGATTAASGGTTAKSVVIGWTLAMTLFVVAGSLCEDVKEIPGLYAPFLRSGGPLRLGRLLLAPGWPSGLWFTAVLLPGVFVVLWDRVAAPARPVFFTALVGTLFVPLAILRVLLRSRFRTFRGYLALQTLSVLPAVGFGLAKLLEGRDLERFAEAASAFLPLSALVLGQQLPSWGIRVLAPIVLLSVVSLLFESRRVFGRIMDGAAATAQQQAAARLQ